MANVEIPYSNGWTISISEDDTPPAVCSVAAWPTNRREYEHWYEWEPGVRDRRCHTHRAMLEAIRHVINLPTIQ